MATIAVSHLIWNMEAKQSPARRGSASASQSGQAFAKAILLGDKYTGRASLIRNLSADSHAYTDYDDRQHGSNNQSQKDFFLAIELSAMEVDYNQPALLKIWAYSDNLSKKDEQLAFRGALFTIISFNICDAASYQSVFDRWMPLKEQLAPNSFVIVIGSHSDISHARQIPLADICKACTKKDAMYVELSNVTGQNVNLLRRLICRRVHDMLLRREELAALGISTLHSSSVDKEDGLSSEESKQPVRLETRPTNRASIASTALQTELSIAYLEPNIMCDSVGAILASCYGLDSWRGYEEHASELQAMGGRIDGLLQELASQAEESTSNADIALQALALGEDLLRSDNLSQDIYSFDLDGQDDEELGELKGSYQEISEAFRIMGLSVPKSLLQGLPPPEILQNGPNTLPEDYFTSSPHRPNLRKMLVRLPHGGMADMVLDLEGNMEQQIELFLLSHSLAHDDEARKKLVQTTLKVQRDYLETSSRPRSVSSRSTAATAPAANLMSSSNLAANSNSLTVSNMANMASMSANANFGSNNSNNNSPMGSTK